MYKIEITNLENGEKLVDTEAEAIYGGYGSRNEDDGSTDGHVIAYANTDDITAAFLIAEIQNMFADNLAKRLSLRLAYEAIMKMKLGKPLNSVVNKDEVLQ